MFRFPSIKHAPSETRRLLRDRIDRKLRVRRHTHHLAPDAEVISDQLMLRLLQCLDVTFQAEWGPVEAAYAAANPSSAEPKDLGLWPMPAGCARSGDVSPSRETFPEPPVRPRPVQ